MDDLENGVEKSAPSLAACDWQGCKDRGVYTRCYFNHLFVLCPRYIAHKNYLKEVREMKIIKNKTPISCNNEECVVRGEFYWCYRNQEKECGIYRKFKNEDSDK